MIIEGATEGDLLAAIERDYRAQQLQPGDITVAMVAERLGILHDAAHSYLTKWIREHPDYKKVTPIDPATYKRVMAARKCE